MATSALLDKRLDAEEIDAADWWEEIISLVAASLAKGDKEFTLAYRKPGERKLSLKPYYHVRDAFASWAEQNKLICNDCATLAEELGWAQLKPCQHWQRTINEAVTLAAIEGSQAEMPLHNFGHAEGRHSYDGYSYDDALRFCSEHLAVELNGCET